MAMDTVMQSILFSATSGLHNTFIRTKKAVALKPPLLILVSSECVVFDVLGVLDLFQIEAFHFQSQE